ncbi:hypothetical protein MAE02_64160 [Microvirga aerophila]|uniref:Uncharacterized protein n=1 Tax=Microvirga aerophila TaxID=670291 RepID=A0A512C3E3_9HYPH|nr:hypothetical protein MAE02_64160 [Microvirga aerophila]
MDPHDLTLVVDTTDLAEAEPYDIFLTHPRAHYEVWEGWRQLGPAGLAKRVLPKAIAWHEYEDFPRGRIVFNSEKQTFLIYADRRLQVPSLLTSIIREFGLEGQHFIIRSDAHYRSRRKP